MHVVLFAACSFLLFVRTTTGLSYEEKNLTYNGTTVLATSECDGIPGHITHDDVSEGESSEICAPSPYLAQEPSLVVHKVTSTSVLLSWAMKAANDSKDSMLLAGYFLTGKSQSHSFQNVVSGQLLSHHVQWLRPWTNYTLILRPFYTETGRPHKQYKIGKAASAQVQTLSSEPEVPSKVSVLAVQKRNVVLSIVGPSSWNSAPMGFYLNWVATSESGGPQGTLEAPLTKDWTAEENTLNVTLPLQGFIDYRISVRALGTGSSGAVLRGPEMEVDVFVTFGSYELSAYAASSTEAIVSWRTAVVADYFAVVLYSDSGNRDFVYYSTWKFRGTERAPSRYSVLIPDLTPWNHFLVTVEGCSGGICGECANTTFNTLPRDLPSPSMTKAAATSNSSFVAAWTFPEKNTRLYEGFRVRYCLSNKEECFVLHTTENAVTVRGLEPDTTFEISVRVKLRSPEGRQLLGPATRASVTTWSDFAVPVIDAKLVADMQERHSCLLQWTCNNSRVDYLQYMAHGGDYWYTCNSTADCDVTILYERTATAADGYMRLTRKVQYIFGGAFIRACNSYGCGPECLVLMSDDDDTGPPRLSSVSVEPQGKQTRISWRTPHVGMYNGVELEWKCSGDEGVAYNSRISENTYGVRQSVHVPSGKSENCSFNVSTYIEDPNGPRYYSTPTLATSSAGARGREQQKKTGPRERRFG